MCAQSLIRVHSATPGLWPTRLLCPWYFSGKNTGVGCHFLFQGIFLTQESNQCLLHLLHLLHWQVDSLPQSHLGSPYEQIIHSKNINMKRYLIGRKLFNPLRQYLGMNIEESSLISAGRSTNGGQFGNTHQNEKCTLKL